MARTTALHRKRLFLTLLTLPRGAQGGVLIQPRWPARQVRVDALVLAKLQTIQTRLPARVTLVLTRGFEPRESKLGLARCQFRKLGIRLFSVLYPHRANEINDIFGCNGHDVDGTHIDVSFCLDGRRVRLLPLGVFTPLGWQHRRLQRCGSAVDQIRSALINEGFQLHHNTTESLQMHCDLTLEHNRPPA